MNASVLWTNRPAQASLAISQYLPALHIISVPKSLGQKWYLSTPAIGFFIFMGFYLRWLSTSTRPVVKAPIAGYRSAYEPTFLLRLRFVFGALKIMNDGYHKFKNSCYVVRRMDTDLTILPSKYLDELRRSTHNELNATNANLDNVLGHYTNLDPMRTNEQFLNVITHCLNPNINEFMKEAQDELNYGLKVDMPDFVKYEWKSVDIHSLLRRLVSRIASRLMVGHPSCRDETMLSITESHTMCIFAVALILRRFPPILHPVISWMIPYRWRILRNMRDMEKIVQPLFERYQAAEVHGDTDSEAREPLTLFRWMVNHAKPHTKSLSSLVSVQLAVTVAAIYTSSQVTSHMLVFIAANPDIAEELRQEIRETAYDLEHIDHSKLRKMEACLAETLRLNPPETNAPQRLAMKDITLSDGVVIPQHALVAFPCSPISLDPEIYPDPHEFKLRPEGFAAPVTTPTSKHLAFGWGSQACPGRFLAAKEIKLVVARLLMEYDIELGPRSTKMRRSYDIEDLRVLNPQMRVYMRRRLPRSSSTTL